MWYFFFSWRFKWLVHESTNLTLWWKKTDVRSVIKYIMVRLNIFLFKWECSCIVSTHRCMVKKKKNEKHRSCQTNSIFHSIFKLILIVYKTFGISLLKEMNKLRISFKYLNFEAIVWNTIVCWYYRDFVFKINFFKNTPKIY